jgi:hypothetical protein
MSPMYRSVRALCWLESDLIRPERAAGPGLSNFRVDFAEHTCEQTRLNATALGTLLESRNPPVKMRDTLQLP